MSCSRGEVHVDSKKRAQIMGHSTTKLTDDVYTRVYDPDLIAAMDTLDQALRD